MSLLSAGVRAEWPVEQEQALRAGFVQAKAGALADDTTALLRNNILLPWLQAIEHKQNIATLSQAQLLDAINVKPGDPSSVWLLGQWRAELIRRQDWASTRSLKPAFPMALPATAAHCCCRSPYRNATPCGGRTP